MRYSLFAVVSLFLISTQNTYARDNAETIRLMKLNTKIQCSFYIDYTLQTKDGLGTPDKAPDIKYFFKALRPQPSSHSDFATYSLHWENRDYSFYYFMNSQVGEIRISSKAKRIEVHSDLDLSDMAKEELKVGQVRLIQTKNTKVTHPVTGDEVDGEMTTYLAASCWRDK